ncbi:hypothetical protein, partial [Nocardia farcinica]|uniref:hypothetical protein n=1 Tax=Nocardia farcinica TaxID=37329 RepID=UPI001E33CAD9
TTDEDVEGFRATALDVEAGIIRAVGSREDLELVRRFPSSAPPAATTTAPGPTASATSAAPTPSPTATKKPKPPDPISMAALIQKKYDGRDLKVGRQLGDFGAYKRYLITYRGDGLKISGVMNVPDGKGPFP